MPQLPDWMIIEESYVPPKDGGTFVVKTLRTLGGIISGIRVQKGHEKRYALPAVFKLLLLVLLLLLLSLTQDPLVILAYAAVIHAYLATWDAGDFWPIIRAGLFAGAFTFLLLLPSIVIYPPALYRRLAMAGKVFLSLEMVGVLNHTTQWNHITSALRRLHIPAVFVFTLDVTLKYIVLLGELLEGLLTAVELRSVGKSDHKYASVGGVLGVTFIRSEEMNRQMYEAMRCRGFTGDYGEAFK